MIMGDDEVEGFVPTSLKDLTRDRWMNEMIGPLIAQNPDAWFIMVADTVAQSMIGGSCRIGDLNKNRIALLENLEKVREPFPGMDVIYVIQPEPESVQLIIEDWDEVHEDPYMNIHIFFLAPVKNQELLSKIANLGKKERIATCKEVNIMFQPVDGHGFSLGMDPDHYATMFGRGMRPENVKNWKTLMVDSITSLCTSLGEKPKHVRYWNFPSKSLTKDVAEGVREAIDKQTLNLPASETTVLILDRSFDMVTPFMDHWCWGHIILENFEIDITKAAEWGLMHTEQGPKLVDEDDYAFDQLRFMLYPVAKKSFGGLANENCEAYPAAAKMQELGGFGKLADDDPLKKNALKELVQYKDNDAEIKFHVGLARKLRSFENKMEDLIQFMQSCAMVDTSSYKDEKVDGKIDTWKKLCQILEARQQFTQVQRDKALLCYIAGIGGLANSEREYLHKFDRADGTDYVGLLNKMEEGFSTGKNKRKKEKPAPKNRDINDFRLVEQVEKWSMDSWVYQEVSEAEGQIVDKAKIYNRWTPRIRRIVEGILENDEQVLKDTKRCAAKDDAPTEAPKKDDDNKKKKKLKQSKKEPAGDVEAIEGLHSWRGRYHGKKFIPGKVVIFCIGGVCHAELQAAYELIAKYDLDVYIGGTALMTGKSFVDAVRLIKAE